MHWLPLDHEGAVIFSAWRVLFGCTSANEADARACVEGIRLASQWAPSSAIIETDLPTRWMHCKARKDRSEISFISHHCRGTAAQEAPNCLRNGRSFRLKDAQLLEERKIVQFKRQCYITAHELAHLARRNNHTAVWLRQTPAECACMYASIYVWTVLRKKPLLSVTGLV